jgi:hypothetical protein
MQRCPRCSYTGRGTPYFRRPGHVALLVGVSLFTQGIGGVVYWLLRRKHRICPRCGLGWRHAYPILPSGQPAERLPMSRGDFAPHERLPSGGLKRQVLGTLLVVIASLLIVIGVVEFEAGAIVGGSLMGAAGSGALFWGWKAKQERRQALMAGLQRKVLRLATRRGGALTVTEVATELNLSMQAAEKVLLAMDDGFRVRSEITREGILLFEFPEVQHRPGLESGSQEA